MAQQRNRQRRSNGTQRGAAHVDRYAAFAPKVKPPVSSIDSQPSGKKTATKRRAAKKQLAEVPAIASVIPPVAETRVERFMRHLESTPDETDTVEAPVPTPNNVTPLTAQLQQPTVRRRARNACAYESCDRVGKICKPGSGSFRCAQERYLESRLELIERFVAALGGPERFSRLIEALQKDGGEEESLDQCG